MTLARFPLQNGRIPSDLYVLRVQSITPLYGLSNRPLFNISPWFWTSSLTRSIGAAAVFEIPAATPLKMKFSTKEMLWVGMVCKKRSFYKCCFNTIALEYFFSRCHFAAHNISQNLTAYGSCMSKYALILSITLHQMIMFS